MVGQRRKESFAYDAGPAVSSRHGLDGGATADGQGSLFSQSDYTILVLSCQLFHALSSSCRSESIFNFIHAACCFLLQQSLRSIVD